MGTVLKTSVSGLPRLSLNEICTLAAPTGIFKSSSFNLHRMHFYVRKSGISKYEERLLGGVTQPRAIKCFDPVIAKKYFGGHHEKRENDSLKVVEWCNNQTKVDANLSAAWSPQWKNFEMMVGELELLIKGIYFVPPASRTKAASWVCFAKGPRPRKPRVWKSRTKIGTVSKSEKLVQHVKTLSNVKEEVYGALDSFIAWEVEFPLITVKKALKTLQAEKQWKRIIQITKWMFSKGQGKTMGNYYLLLNALAEEKRIEEAEELWNQIFRRHLEYVPKMLFTRVITMYEQNNMSDKLLEVFADMEELGVKPDSLSITIVANTFKNLGMLEKYEKVLKKYPETKSEDRHHNSKPYPVQVHKSQKYGEAAVQQNDSSSNGTEEIESLKDDFPTAEDREQQNEVSESLDKRDCTRVPISI